MFVMREKGGLENNFGKLEKKFGFTG